MNDVPIPIEALIAILVALIGASAFFSASETALMSLNRYRLRHLADSGHRGAMRALALLKEPERILGLILLGNNFVNIVASALATVVALRVGGEAALAAATGLLTLAVLIFAEVAPKTLAARNPERIAYFAAIIYTPTLKLVYPAVWLVNMTVKGLFRLIGLSVDGPQQEALSREELRTVLRQSGQRLPRQQFDMLLNLMDFTDLTVDDVMIPRNEIVGIDINDDWETILNQIVTSRHTVLPVYDGDIDKLRGVVHLRRLLELLQRNTFGRKDFDAQVREGYFTPENTPLTQQLLNFQREHQGLALVVDEYGDIIGLVTLDDTLEQIVGDHSAHHTQEPPELRKQENGAYLADGSMAVRQLQRQLGWEIEVDEAKTLAGLILEHLQELPEAGSSVVIDQRRLDILEVSNNAVRQVRIHPPSVDTTSTDG